MADGEKIVHRAAISHWRYAFYYLGAVSFFAAGLFGFYMSSVRENISPLIALVPILIGLLLVLIAVVARLTTELVLTDRRIITKRGLISRDTMEMNLSKVESVHVNQGLLGRLLNFGDVTVVGTGSSPEPLRGIADPLELRRALGALTQTPAAKSFA